MKKKTTSARRRANDGSKNYEISGIVIFCFGIFAFISLFGLFGGGTGLMGKWVSDGIHFLFGLGAPAAALFLILFGARYALASRGISMSRRNVLLALLFVLFLCLVHHYYVPSGREMEISSILSYGGIIGGGLTSFFHLILGEIGTTILLLALMVVDILLLTHWSLSKGAEKVGTRAQKISAKTGEKLGGVAQKIRDKKAAMDAARSAARLEVLKDKPTEFIFKKKKKEEPEPDEEIPEETLPVENEQTEEVPVEEH